MLKMDASKLSGAHRCVLVKTYDLGGFYGSGSLVGHKNTQSVVYYLKKTVFLWQERRNNQSVIFLSINPFLKMVIPPPLWETTIPTVLVT